MILFCQQKDAFYVLSLSALGTERERDSKRHAGKYFSTKHWKKRCAIL